MHVQGVQELRCEFQVGVRCKGGVRVLSIGILKMISAFITCESDSSNPIRRFQTLISHKKNHQSGGRGPESAAPVLECHSKRYEKVASTDLRGEADPAMMRKRTNKRRWRLCGWEQILLLSRMDVFGITIGASSGRTSSR
jgi:hypothetical protein